MRGCVEGGRLGGNLYFLQNLWASTTHAQNMQGQTWSACKRTQDGQSTGTVITDDASVTSPPTWALAFAQQEEQEALWRIDGGHQPNELHQVSCHPQRLPQSCRALAYLGQGPRGCGQQTAVAGIGTQGMVFVNRRIDNTIVPCNGQMGGLIVPVMIVVLFCCRVKQKQ